MGRLITTLCSSRAVIFLETSFPSGFLLFLSTFLLGDKSFPPMSMMPPAKARRTCRELIHRSTWKELSANFAFPEFSEIHILALCVEPILCSSSSYVEYRRFIVRHT